MEYFVLVRDFVQEYFVLNFFQFIKLEKNCQLVGFMVKYFGGDFFVGVFCIELFPPSEMGDKLSIGRDKL